MAADAMTKISYGLYVLAARGADGKAKGCIVNTLSQATGSPEKVLVTVSKLNCTHEALVQGGIFTATILDESAPFSLFESFGFRSSRDADKFSDVKHLEASNGVPYLVEHASGFVSGRVIETVDLGSHTLFIAEVTEKGVLSEIPSLTYAYYHANVKPRPKPASGGKKTWRCKTCGYIFEGEALPEGYRCPMCEASGGEFEPMETREPGKAPRKVWRCRICGYIYEGETLPPDFVCPTCKHGAADFELVEI